MAGRHLHLCDHAKWLDELQETIRAHQAIQRMKSVELTPEQAQIVATAIQTYYSQLQVLEQAYNFQREISAAEYSRMQEVAEYAVTQSFDRLSAGAQSRLSDVLDNLKERAAVSFVEGVDPRAEQQWLMDKYLADFVWGDAEVPQVNYTPYEFHRLCRTEAAFSRGEVQRSAQEEAGVTYEVVDGYDEGNGVDLPIHPNCNCEWTSTTGKDGREYAVIWPAPTCCEICLDLAEAVEAAVPR